MMTFGREICITYIRWFMIVMKIDIRNFQVLFVFSRSEIYKSRAKFHVHAAN